MKDVFGYAWFGVVTCVGVTLVGNLVYRGLEQRQRDVTGGCYPPKLFDVPTCETVLAGDDPDAPGVCYTKGANAPIDFINGCEKRPRGNGYEPTDAFRKQISDACNGEDTEIPKRTVIESQYYALASRNGMSGAHSMDFVCNTLLPQTKPECVTGRIEKSNDSCNKMHYMVQKRLHVLKFLAMVRCGRNNAL